MWKPVALHLGPYEVSTDGRVRRSDTGREKKVTIAVNGYPVVGLWRENRGAVCYIHDLVMAAFVGPKPEGACVNHIDGVKSNSVLLNLEYTSFAGNSAHASENGLTAHGTRSPHAKLTDEQARDIYRLCWNEPIGIQKHLSLKYGISNSIISEIKHGKRWRHLKLHHAS